MLLNKKTITLSSLICASLVGCGGGTDSAEELISGYAINTNNASSVIQTVAVDTAELTDGLLNIESEFNTNTMIVSDYTETSRTYDCNLRGTMTIDEPELATSTESLQNISFDDCTHNDVHYHGEATLDTFMEEGTLDDRGSYISNWSAKQYSTLTNFARTAPASNGVTNVTNGDIIITTSNNTETGVFARNLTGSDLSYALTAGIDDTSSYDFENISYTSNLHNIYYADERGLDFVANHSELGIIQLVTDPLLEIDSVTGTLEDGTATLSTELSILQLQATGNDGVDIQLDVDGNGTYDIALPSSTFSTLFE